MEYRNLDLTVISARDLKDVNLISKMDVYVVVSLDGDPRGPKKSRSPVDHDGGRNPAWNFPVKLYVDEPSAQQNRLTLRFKLRCDRALGDKDVGEVVVPVKELLDSTSSAPGGGKASSAASQPTTVTYQVRKPSGKPKGELHFSYKFSDKLTGELPAAADYSAASKADAAVTAYPVQAGPSGSYGAVYPPPPAGAYPPPPPAAYAYPPPPPGYAPPPPQYGAYGYPPPPQAGYGYAQPPPPGYGYYPNQQQAQQPQKKNKLGLGLGAGLAGGLLGGLLIGDMVSDAGDYGGGYDGGFDGGF
ncbi:hypothetical protein BT93_H2432 [Corymbia citriodora subsp. variegata]|nr:hypothetical protein BT93_H2432 [Corymbia citriodora subsp. variegata]